MKKNVEEDFEGWNIVWINSTDITQCQNLLNNKHIDGIGISSYKGFNEIDISFLRSLKNLRALAIPFTTEYHLEFISDLVELEYLMLGERKEPINFEMLEKLKGLRIRYLKNDRLPKPDYLKKLYLNGFKTSTKNLDSLSKYSLLERLELVNGNIESLKGIEKLKCLKEVHFNYIRQLKDISFLAKTHISLLKFTNCKKIKNVDSLAFCKNLEKLSLNSCGKIENIIFLENLKKLKEFIFFDTEVLDGDLTLLQRLNYVGFNDKKHYSHKYDEIINIINK